MILCASLFIIMKHWTECEWYGQLYCSGDIIIDLYSWKFLKTCANGKMVRIQSALSSPSSNHLFCYFRSFMAALGKKLQLIQDFGYIIFKICHINLCYFSIFIFKKTCSLPTLLYNSVKAQLSTCSSSGRLCKDHE